MVRAYTQPDGEIVADSLPKVGDKMRLAGWGEVDVVSLTHNARGNYISLTAHMCRGGGDYTFTAQFVVKGDM